MLKPTALLALLLLAPGSARAALDPETEKPYQLTIVLDVGKHRMLTEVFRQQIRRDLRDGLQAAFGDAVRVEVTDAHPKLADVRRHGLKETLDRWPELTGAKTHFVFLDYVNGQYEIRACQHDGMTGIASPVVRKERTSDPQFVSRLIALMIDTDFGIVGTFQPGADGQVIRVELKASKLGGEFDRKVRAGDVFGVAPIFHGKDETRRLEDALLVVARDADKGGFDASLFERYQSNRGVVAGYRCVRLHTIRAPLRLRVVQRDTAETPAFNLQLEARRLNFKDDDGVLKGTTLTDGSFTTEKVKDQGAFAGKAFVTIIIDPFSQPRKTAIVPIAIVDDKPVRVRVKLEKDNRSDLVIRKDLWEKEAFNSGLAQQALFKALNEAKPEARGEAIKLAREGVKRSKEFREQLGKERDELAQESKTAGTPVDLSIGEQWLKFLEAGEVKLIAYLEDQKKIDEAEKDPKRQQWLEWVKDAKLEEGRGEFGKALDLYKMALDGGLKDEPLQKYYDQLKGRWAIKSPEHEAARRFIYDTWPRADLSKERVRIGEAKNHLATCKTAGDVLTPQKLLHAAIAHGGKLKDQKESLQVETSEEDRKTADEIAAASKELGELIKAVQDYLKDAVK